MSKILMAVEIVFGLAVGGMFFYMLLTAFFS